MSVKASPSFIRPVQPVQIALSFFFFTSISLLFFLPWTRITQRIWCVANIHRFHIHRSPLVPGQEKWRWHRKEKKNPVSRGGSRFDTQSLNRQIRLLVNIRVTVSDDIIHQILLLRKVTRYNSLPLLYIYRGLFYIFCAGRWLASWF